MAARKRTLERCLTFGGPGSSSEIEAITVAPQPGLKEPSEKEHLGEILSLARAILRELQAPRPLQVFAPNREMEAFVRALMKPQRGLGNTDAEDKAEMAGVA